MPLTLAVPRETAPGERRVALTPDAAARLAKAGLTVRVQAGAGERAFASDEDYREAGAEVVEDQGRLLAEAGVVVRVAAPSPEEAEALREGAVLVCFLQPQESGELLQALAGRRVTAFSLNLLPRTTRAQPMDALSSMATIAGYKAVLLAADRLPRFLPMLVTAAGTIPPAKALVLGAGVAGLQAIATARRLGAVVSAFDVRAAAKEQVQSLGARFLEVELVEGGEGKGGYARELSEEDKRRTQDLVDRAVGEADFVITTAAVPGKRAPRLITAETVGRMRAGSVIVDLAAEGGGNCALTRPGEEVVEKGVTILGPLNLVSTMPFHASQMYARNISAFVGNLVKDGELRLDFEDEILKESCAVHDGEVRVQT